MEKIGLFYGPEGGSTEKVAKKIAEAIGGTQVDLIPVKDQKATDLAAYDNLIFGISTIGKETWKSDEAPNDWDVFMPELEEADLNGKVVAMFGLGDHLKYALHFVDAMGILAEKLKNKNVTIVGQCDTDDYQFEESQAIVDGKFIGLPIDEDYEADKTDDRVHNWVANITKAFK